MTTSPPPWLTELPPAAAKALAVHRATLEEWRPAMDLVGPGPLDPHFADAVGAVHSLHATGRWADLGSGAGFPGIALAALHPAAAVTLVERRSKRAAFLSTVVERAGLTNVTVVTGNAETMEDQFDGVISRAFAPQPRLWPLAGRLVRPGGVLALMLAKEEAEPPEGWDLFHVERYLVGDRVRRVEVWKRLPEA